METVHLDSSAYVKRFAQERGSENLNRIFEVAEQANLVLVTSQWSIGESIAAVDKKFRKKEITQHERDTIIATILEESAELSGKGQLTLVPAKSEFTAASWRIIIRHHVSADDALQVLSATVGVCSVFVAVDDLLVKVSQEEGFADYNIAKGEESKKLMKLLKL